MREFGFGANRLLRPYQNPDVEPVFRAYRPTEAEVNSLGYDDTARRQDQLVLQEDLINQQMAAQQNKLRQDQRKVARLEQVQDIEDQANEAINSGVPANQVIQQYPGLVQSPSFNRYAQMAKMATPAQQTLAPHFRKSLKSPIARQYFDKHFAATGDATQAHDLAQADEMNDNLKVELVKHGVPFNIVESRQQWTPLMAQAAIQSHGTAKKDTLHELGYRKAVSKYFDDLKAEQELAGEGVKPRDMRKVKEDLDELHSVFFPEAAVHPVSAGVAPKSKVESLAARYGILKQPEPAQPAAKPANVRARDNHPRQVAQEKPVAPVEKAKELEDDHRGILAYRLDRSDTIDTVAAQFTTTPEQIRKMNHIPPDAPLKAGEEILVPAMGAVTVGSR